jgi:hypothetical protein
MKPTINSSKILCPRYQAKFSRPVNHEKLPGLRRDARRVSPGRGRSWRRRAARWRGSKSGTISVEQFGFYIHAAVKDAQNLDRIGLDPIERQILFGFQLPKPLAQIGPWTAKEWKTSKGFEPSPDFVDRALGQLLVIVGDKQVNLLQIPISSVRNDQFHSSGCRSA